MWVCPECDRPFGRRNQGHFCAPGMSVDEFFSTGHARERPIYEAIMARLSLLDDVVIDPVQVGIFFKRGPTFAELRPMTRWVAVTFVLERRLESPRLSRKVSRVGAGGRWYHVVNVDDAEQVDDELLDWLTEAHAAAGPASGQR